MSKVYDAYCKWLEETNFEMHQPDEVWEAATERALRAVEMAVAEVLNDEEGCGNCDDWAAAKVGDEIRRLIEEDENL